VNLLIDENLSPRLVQLLAAKGIAAQHVAHVGLSGATDPKVWRYAYDHDQAVVTINASDFLVLAAAVELHPGLIVLRSRGLTREEQWGWLEPIVDSVIDSARTSRTGWSRFTVRGSSRSAIFHRDDQPGCTASSGCMIAVLV
jgi:predicted nuclease of predicted toxin-antitoxin system